MQKTIISVAVLLTLSSPVIALESISADTTFSSDATIQLSATTESDKRYSGIISNNRGPITIDILNNSLLKVTNKNSSLTNVERWYGIAAQEDSSLNINGDLAVDLVANSEEIRALRANGGNIRIDGDYSVTATGKSGFVRAVDVWSGADVLLNGTTKIYLEAENGTISAVGVGTGTGSKKSSLLLTGALTDITAKTTGGRIVGVENFNSQGGIIQFNADETNITIINDKKSDNLTQAVLAYRSTTEFNGKTTIKVNGGANTTYGVDVQCDPGLPEDTIVSFNGTDTIIDVTGTGTTYAVRPSGSTGSINFTGSVVQISATSEDANASGIRAQYGASANFTHPNSTVSINATANNGIAKGIENSTYAKRFGSVNIEGNANINAEGLSAYGIDNSINDYYVPEVITEKDGVDFSGKVTINVTAIEGEAIGINASNYLKDDFVSTAHTNFNQISVVANGENGAKAIGIQGKDKANIQIDGNSTVIATGDNAIGLVLENSVLDASSNMSITGDTLGISMTNDAELNINDAGHITTNTMKSEGTTNLDTDSILTVTGGKDTSSSLGTVNANSASLELGSGSYDISTLTGDNNSLVLTDLSNTETVAIQTKSGRLAMRATGASNDQYDNAQAAANALSKVVEIETDNTAEGNTLAVEEGAVNNGLTAKIDANGNLSDVAETKNTKLDALGSVSALSAMTLRHEMNNLSKRMGELRDAPAGVGVWARYFGSEMEYGAQNLTSKNNTIQIGSDYTVGDWKVGVAANYTDGESSYDNGSADNKNYGFAVYGTWFVPCGAYVDLIAKYSRMDNDFALNGMNGSYENNAFNVSAETGYRFEFMDGGLFVEPQVGVSYGRIMGDDFTAQNGVRVEQDDYDSLIGRVGVRTGFKFPKDKGLIYARVSGLYDFQGEMNATATSGSARNTIEEDLGGAWLELGVGANFNWTDNTYSYIDIERTNGGDVKENYRFNVGIRHTF